MSRPAPASGLQPSPDTPVRAPGPVPVDVVRDLLASVSACVPGADPAPLVDLDVAAAHLGRFKLDVSFALTRDGAPHARVSLNDKGEPEAFRERLRAVLPGLGVPIALLDAFLALSPPGQVQTTVSVKWTAGGGLPARVGLYYEELSEHPELVPATLALAGLSDTLPALPPVAVCLDVAGGRFAAGRHYHHVVDTREEQPAVELSDAMTHLRASLPWHPRSGRRPWLYARRVGPAGGTKLLWMTECHRPEDAAWAWGEVERLRATLGLPDGPVARVLDGLRAGWRHDAFLHPDLVSVNAGGDGEPEALLVYVSAR